MIPAPPPTDESARLAALKHAQAPIRAGARVVLAEDDPVSQKLTRLLLQRLGLEVHVAPDGKCALDLIKQVSPDLVLMDMHMPVMNGPDAIRALRADGAAPQPLVVILSANVFADQEAQDMASLDVAEILGKPINRAQLQTVLARLLPA